MTYRSLLEVEDLRVAYAGGVQAVRGVSFRIGASEKLGIVGESGSGKSQTARAIAHLLPPSAHVEAQRLRFGDKDLLAMPSTHRRRLRGRNIAMVMQDPHHALNPVMRVGDQIDEVHIVHHRVSRAQARERTLQVLESLRIRDPERVCRAYPHEISGGMGQRIMIAMMLAPEPQLLLADEPTSALDEHVAAGVLEELRRQADLRQMALLLISHDLDLVRSFCDRVLIMYAGRIVEACRTDELDRATHPYTRGLLDCVPRLGSHGTRLPTLSRSAEWRQ
ncbi:ABC transporter ATP-binding protein [Paraburkholderia tropica]|uniref:ABC transporter ATP-binding protein n=1 Tax=Paraburkholderia tropica TaxID=92647 RepID=UPI002AB24BCB|nr:ABC transporter ATP-binding protein [Paraburkholderia tropica]